MELRIYDDGLNLVGITENQNSIIWNRKYYEVGNFTIEAPIDANNINIFKIGNVVWFHGAKEAGVIESVLLTKTKDFDKIVIEGRFLESYMDRRIVWGTLTYSGSNVVDVMWDVLYTQTRGNREIPLLFRGDVPQTNGGIVTMQTSHKNVLTLEERLARSSALGYRFRPDFSEKKIYFDVYSGVDHSSSQQERSQVVFSEEFANLLEATYQESDQLLKTVARVGGEGEGSSRQFVVAGNDNLSGLARREMFVDADDISSEEMTPAEYTQALLRRGTDKMQENRYSSMFEAVANPYGNFTYKVDYDLGDIVTIKKKMWGVSDHKRLTEVTETYANGATMIVPVFGDPLPETIDWSDD